MLSTHLKRRSFGSMAGPVHFLDQKLTDKISETLSIKLTQQSEIMSVIHYDISEDKLMLALKTFLRNNVPAGETISVHVYKNENGHTKFVSNEGILAIMPAQSGVFSGHALQVAWQKENSNLQSVYEFENDTSFKLVEWIFTLNDAKAWVKKSTMPRSHKEDAVTYSVSISIEGARGIFRTNFDVNYNIEEETAEELVTTLSKYDTTQMDFVKARAIANHISKITAINSAFNLVIMADGAHDFKCAYKDMCLDSFSVYINGTHYFYIDENNYSVETSARTEMSCKDGILKCRGPKELMFNQFQSMDSDIHNLREKYFNLFV